MAKYLIINQAGKIFEYDDSSMTITTALDKYIKEQVKFESGFNLSENAWTTVKTNLASSITTANKISIINGFCKHNKFKISKILSGYTTDYPV